MKKFKNFESFVNEASALLKKQGFDDKSSNEELFGLYKSFWVDHIDSDISMEKRSKEIMRNYGDIKKMPNDQRSVYDKQVLDAQTKKEKLDNLISALKSRGYDTDKMWRDMYMRSNLKDEKTYVK